MTTARPVTVITGISGGFGQAFAHIFSKNGFEIIGISRHEPETPIGHHLSADLTDPASLPHLVEQIGRLTTHVDVLILNAGVGLYDSWKDMNLDELRSLVELNFFSPVALAKRMLPLLKTSKGTIITVSSVAGFLPVPCMGAYCASKYALNAFSDTLRAELLDTGIHVLNILPGRINTGFSTRAFGSRTPPETPFAGSPEKLAKAAFRAYVKKKRQLVYPGWYRFLSFFRNTFPKFYDRLSSGKWKK
ncbi:MAG: SDR family NAD(P)-dependent oxidoreductase [Acidobacteria bacterium]|nr:SDR family NAD(P)-dependent oxidoreductase [Acidobacteriota bacterium]